MIIQKEIGGYFEFEGFKGPHYHESALKLNCGRGCLLYLIELRNIKSIWLPSFLCDSVANACQMLNVDINTYRIGSDFSPIYDFTVKTGDWVYLVDYYGLLSEKSVEDALHFSNGNLILDETQNFFRPPLPEIDTLYTCRKWFGVADGGYLYTKDRKALEKNLSRDKSYGRMNYLLGRLEENASTFFKESQQNNSFFDNEPARKMSYVTDNIMRAIPYDSVAEQRTNNWRTVHKFLKDINLLSLDTPEHAPFAYPLLLRSVANVREALARKKIYIPTLWPNVCEDYCASSTEYRYAQNILPIPIDQRYTDHDMKYLVKELMACLN